MIPPAATSVAATPEEGPVNDTAPPTFKLLSIPTPPLTTNAPVSLSLDSVFEFI